MDYTDVDSLFLPQLTKLLIHFVQIPVHPTLLYFMLFYDFEICLKLEGGYVSIQMKIKIILQFQLKYSDYNQINHEKIYIPL